MRRRGVVADADAPPPPPMATPVMPTLDPPPAAAAAVLIRCTVSGGSRSDVVVEDGWPVAAVKPPLWMPLSEGELLGVRRGRSIVVGCFFACLVAGTRTETTSFLLVAESQPQRLHNILTLRSKNAPGHVSTVKS